MFQCILKNVEMWGNMSHNQSTNTEKSVAGKIQHQMQRSVADR